MQASDAGPLQVPAQSARLCVCIQPGHICAGLAVEVRVSLANDVGKDLSDQQGAPALSFSCHDEAGAVGVSPATAAHGSRPHLLTLSRASAGWARLSVEAEGALGSTSAPFRIGGCREEAPGAGGGPACGLPLRSVALGGPLPRLRLFECCREGVNGKLWDGGLALARFLASAPPGEWLAPPAAEAPLPGLRAVELGAGTGVGSLALAALGLSVVATDEDEGSLGLLRLSSAANGLEGRVRTEVLAWGTESPVLGERYDVVVAADVVYYEDAFIPLVQTLASLAHDSATVLLAHRPRGERDQQAHFFHLLKAEFDLEQIHYDARLSVTIYRLHRGEDTRSTPTRPADTCEYCSFLRQQHAQLHEWPFLGVI